MKHATMILSLGCGSLLVLMPGCLGDALDDWAALTASTSTSSTSGASTSSSDDLSGGIQTVTGDDPSGSSSTTTSGSTSGEPATPVVVGVSFDDPLKKAGVIHVDVTAEAADVVEMTLEDTAMVALTPAPDGHFLGEIEVLTGTLNGTHTASFVPSAGDVVGETKEATYVVDLPAPGEEAVWDVPLEGGLAEVRAVRVTSDQILEFGTRQEQGEPRCYLRRRDFAGAYGDADVVDVLAGKTCQAVDLAVGPGDEVYLLANTTIAGTTRWWLAELTAWGVTTKLDAGAAGEAARALAVGPVGEIAACGDGPTEFNDRDARYWLRYPGGLGWTRAFDYVAAADINKVHVFADTVQDCEFADGKLVMVGRTFGRHDNQPNDPKRDRMTLLELDVDTDEHTWTLADKGPGKMTQSAGTALAIDDHGDYVVGLYTCEDQCDPAGEFRIYSPGGVLAETPLALGADIIPPVAVAFSPAGYIVVASAQGSGWSTKFLVQAYRRGKPLPLWTYTATEGAGPNLAETLTFVPGVVVAGGLSGSGYPALAFIYG